MNRPARWIPPPLRRAGLTLLELLVVVAIIAILAGILLPVVGQVKRRGYAAQSSNNLRQLVAANIAYANDQGVYVPAANKVNTKRWCGARSSTKSPFDPAKGYLADYLGRSRAVTADPLFTEMLKASRSFEEGAGGYGYNAWYLGGAMQASISKKGYNPDGSMRSVAPAQIARPAETMMFATTALAKSGGVQEYPFADPPFWDYGDGVIAGRATPSVHFRFNSKAIVGWCDGRISMESRADHEAGENPYGGDAEKQNLGWFGPDEDNGYWNPNR